MLQFNQKNIYTKLSKCKYFQNALSSDKKNISRELTSSDGEYWWADVTLNNQYLVWKAHHTLIPFTCLDQGQINQLLT